MRTTELDVTTMPPPRRHAEIFRQFESLERGESFVLVNDHYPKPLLYQFQAEYPGAFEWNVLEAGPERYRVEICRRADASPRTVSDYLETDHRRLDDLLPALEAVNDAAGLAKAAGAFHEFACGLNQHIEAEERVLFPAFEELTRMKVGPTIVMRAEHEEIRRLLDQASAALSAHDVAEFRRTLNRLTGMLMTHNVKEEQILYPMTDRAIDTPSARDALVRQMQAI